jgi:cation diffusion facilitator family transporter
MSHRDHVFGQDIVRAGEKRTVIVVVITAVMMVVEIISGLVFGSMALLADGLHMASHAAALSVSVAAYVLARKYARDHRFSFGTGKLNALAAFTSAIMLVMFAALMAYESTRRFLFPVNIAFDQAIIVAVLGLLVNAASMFILGGHHEHDQNHDHEHKHDHSLRAAYLHVLADALTSLLAIFALLTGKYLGALWMDPMMGIVGAVLVARWSWTLIHDSARVLLDRQAPEHVLNEIRTRLETDGAQLADLHVWSIGPNIYAADISLHSGSSKSPEDYRRLLPNNLGLVHVTVEVTPRNP